MTPARNLLTSRLALLPSQAILCALQETNCSGDPGCWLKSSDPGPVPFNSAPSLAIFSGFFARFSIPAQISADVSAKSAGLEPNYVNGGCPRCDFEVTKTELS
jgi:hypothetical protein